MERFDGGVAAIVALGAGYWQAAVFALAMLAGMAFFDLAEIASKRHGPAPKIGSD